MHATLLNVNDCSYVVDKNSSYVHQPNFLNSNQVKISEESMEDPLLGSPQHDDVGFDNNNNHWRRSTLWVLIAFMLLSVSNVIIFRGELSYWVLKGADDSSNGRIDIPDIVESEKGVVAADDSRCSQIGASMLRLGGHAVDAAVATALCVGAVNPMASGIGGGSFMVVRSSLTSKAQAFDMRETAPFAASQNMYANNLSDKSLGARSMGVPGEIAGLHLAWSQHGRLAWSVLFQPAIKLLKYGFVVAPYLSKAIANKANRIFDDPGLQKIYAPNGILLKAGDICYNVELARTLELIAEKGPQAFYNGSVGEKLVKDVKEAGGILTLEDLRNYTVVVTDAMAVNFSGFTAYGMPPPSSGTVGLSMIMNILNSYGNADAANDAVGLHRLIEALKHMFAIRMSLGDPNFVNITNSMSKMLSPQFAEEIRQKIFDNTTFPPEYYMSRWSQLEDHGTSHFCIVDGDRNAVSMTTTVNYPFGGAVLSTSTGIILNNEMDDFSTPTEIYPNKLPPSPTNFIEPNKRPLSSMTPLIITKDNQLAGVIGGSGGIYIIPAVIQVLVNHFMSGMEPLAAVQTPRVYHKLIPNVVLYENWTCIDGDHIELADERKQFLKERGHEVEARAGGAIVQFVVQNLQKNLNTGREFGKDSTFRGMLTAVSDPRKDGRPAAV